MKICPLGAELFRANGWTERDGERERERERDRWTDRKTDMTKLIVALRNLANGPKITVKNLLAPTTCVILND